ncbi:MAG: SufD family Fe-S cluster assembly protein, partial [Sandaracinobacteroides sp.]
MTARPTNRDEAWRYSDMAAVEALWPPAPARLLSVPADAEQDHVIRITEVGIYDVRVELARGARLRLFVAVTAPGYARVAVTARL